VFGQETQKWAQCEFWDYGFWGLELGNLVVRYRRFGKRNLCRNLIVYIYIYIDRAVKLYYNIYSYNCTLTLNLLTTTVVAPLSNASKCQMGFNSAFKGLIKEKSMQSHSNPTTGFGLNDSPEKAERCSKFSVW